MNLTRLASFSLLTLLLGCHGCKHSTGSGAEDPSSENIAESNTLRSAQRDNLVAFTGRDELEGFLRELAASRGQDRKRAQAKASKSEGLAAPAPAEAAVDGKEEESITNTQTAGVDEGGIVKVHKDHLVVLRRGRLFSVKIGERLEKSGQSDAFGPTIDPRGAWYDEMLISGDRIVVVGYSYQRGGTELGVFGIDDAGTITHQATYHMRSNDYYSSRNYASRLIGDKLIFYTPLYLYPTVEQPMRGLPAVRAWHEGAKDEEFEAILEPSEVYRPLTPSAALTLHAVTVCDLSKPGSLPCRARAVMGPPGRVFYVSRDSVYVWMTDYSYARNHDVADAGPREPSSLLYRLPLGIDSSDTAPSVLKVRGAPIDQFSFLEHDGHLNVLVSADSNGDAMWAAERGARSLALFRTPLAAFSRAGEAAPDSRYTTLPTPEPGALQNRFVGDYLLYGVGQSWGRASAPGPLTAVAYAKPEQAPTSLPVGHSIERIEALGGDALAVGNKDNALVFTALALQRKGEPPQIAGNYTLPQARQGETRSHGFFYKADDADHGVFALPVRGPQGRAHHQLTAGSARLLFVKNDRLSFQELGSLASQATNNNDGCPASCVDWYGNARPIFLRGRLFGLLGYELVEGKFGNNEVNEVQRLNFAPAALAR